MITVDWNATKFIGLTLDWEYDNGKLHISMPCNLNKTMT